MPKEGQRRAIRTLSYLQLDAKTLRQLESANAVLASIVEQAKLQGFSLDGLLDAMSMSSDQDISITPADIRQCLSTYAPPSYKTAMILELALEISPAFSRHYTQPDQNGSGPGEQSSYQQ